MVDKKKFFSKFPYRPLSQTGVDTIENIIDQYDEDDGYTNLRQLAYVLATAYHESAHTWNPSIREYGRGKGRKYGSPHAKTGQIYYGRGLCQLTWFFNYESFSKILGEDLINDPDLALESRNSVDILMIGMREGVFTRHKLNMYFDEDTTDWVGARKIINGTDRANLIASYAKAFYKGLDYLSEDDKANEEADIVNIQNPKKSLTDAESEMAVKVEVNGKNVTADT
ncbi:MAG: glycoside hydrolase family 19 protein [bacterium]|nr:glycoside hydrolase family 19 protein [bacterium]